MPKMKTYRVVLFVGGDSQWITVEANNATEASKKALNEIQVLEVREIK